MKHFFDLNPAEGAVSPELLGGWLVCLICVLQRWIAGADKSSLNLTARRITKRQGESANTTLLRVIVDHTVSARSVILFLSGWSEEANDL